MGGSEMPLSPSSSFEAELLYEKLLTGSQKATKSFALRTRRPTAQAAWLLMFTISKGMRGKELDL